MKRILFLFEAKHQMTRLPFEIVYIVKRIIIMDAERTLTKDTMYTEEVVETAAGSVTVAFSGER